MGSSSSAIAAKFRDHMIAAPLKRIFARVAGVGRMEFRDHMIAAPLKQEMSLHHGRYGVLQFRDHMIAAPLKQQSSPQFPLSYS